MRLLVVGTGTEIGKTHVSTCLLAFARSRVFSAGAYKPVATGVESHAEDSEAHAAALAQPYDHPTYAYRRPVSPHLAAREEGRPIDLRVIATQAAKREEGKSFFLVETAGGLFSPLGETETNADLVKALSPALVLLVAPDRIGVLHDIRACLIAAKAMSVAIAALVLSAPNEPDASTGTNAAELSRLGIAEVAGVFPRAPFDAPESRAMAEGLWSAIASASRP